MKKSYIKNNVWIKYSVIMIIEKLFHNDHDSYYLKDILKGLRREREFRMISTFFIIIRNDSLSFSWVCDDEIYE